MRKTSDGRRVPPRRRAPLRAPRFVRASADRSGIGIIVTLLCTLLLAACDGGIFGTGDGSGVGPPVDAGSPSTSGETTTGSDSDVGDGEVSGGDTTDADSADGGSGEDDTGVPSATGTDTAQPTVPSIPFENTLITGDTSTPRLRLINASDTRVALVDAEGDALLSADLLQVSEYVDVPLGTDSLTIRRRTERGSMDVYRLEPLTLGASSVTTLVVRDRAGTDDDEGTDAVPLRTLTSPDDLAQSLVRIVRGVRSSAPDEAEGTAETFALVPDGASPGGAEVVFEGIAFDAAPSDIDYASAPAGDYSLSGSNGDVSSLPLSLEGGTVYTLVIVGTDSVLRVIDGAPGSR